MCGCEEIGSPIPGVLLYVETLPGFMIGGELERCDTHQPKPLFESDEAAADYAASLGWSISEVIADEDGSTYFWATRRNDEH